MIENGWEFLIINPFAVNIIQTCQNTYEKNYNLSYEKFINEFYIPEPYTLFENDNLFTFYISWGGELDKIELEEKFDIIFLKSVFLKTSYKKIKSDIEKYYNTYNIGVRNLYKSGDYIVLIIEKIS
jgi:hypothetical protein